LTAIFTPSPVDVIFAVPILVPCAFTMSACADLDAAAANWTAAEKLKIPAITITFRMCTGPSFKDVGNGMDIIPRR
jgi:hypothetical protein